jgi:outer membrane immunogenic protein
MKTLSAAAMTIGALVSGSGAFAADMPIKAPTAAALVYGWTGFYLGGGFGYGMFNLDTSLTQNGTLQSDNQTWAGRGWFATVTGGYDQQFSDRIVAGVFADADFSNNKGRLGDVYWEQAGAIKQRWAWAVGARIGYLIHPAVLSYVNAGYTQAQFSRVDLFNFGLANDPALDFFPAQTYGGWFVGGGLEAMLSGGWSVKTEYRLADYGTRTVQIIDNSGAPTGAADRIHPYVQTVRSELVYRFNSGRTAYAAAARTSALASYNWTGFYVGGGAGYGMFNLDTSLTRSILESDNQTLGGRGWFGTVTVGADYQFSNRVVAGAFADWDFSNIRGHLGDTWWEQSGKISQRSAQAVGARLGYLVLPTVLSYVDGGFTRAHFSNVNLWNFGIASDPSGDIFPAQTYSGWFFGGGLETPLAPGWFVKTEYRYANYGSRSVPAFVDGTNTVLDIRPVVQTVRSELVYKFNWGQGPISARN